MKHKKYTCIFCLIFAIFFLINGICPTPSNAHSSSFSTQNTTSTSRTLSSHHFIPEPEQCTLEMLGQNCSVSITNTSRNTNLLKYTFSFLYILPIALLRKQSLSNSYNVENQGNPLKIPHFYIMCYIHHKDGKKQMSSN